MKRQSVTSSNIVSIGYDEESQTLEVEFRGGGVYVYEGVSQSVYNAFKDAESVGSFFQKNIRPKYTGKRATEE